MTRPNLARIEPANLKAAGILTVLLRAFNICNGQFWHWLAKSTLTTVSCSRSSPLRRRADGPHH
jgi:hypothetical protein